MGQARVGNLLLLATVLLLGFTASTVQAGLGASLGGAPMRAPATAASSATTMR